MTTLALLRTRLILLMMVVVTPALGPVLYGNLEQRRIEKAGIRKGAVALSQLGAARLESYVNNTRQLLATFSEISFLVLSSNQPLCQTHFSNLRKLLPDYLNFGLIETNGMLFCTAEPTNAALNLSQRPYFRRVLQTRKFAIGEFQLGGLTGQPALNFGYPVLDGKGKLRRVLYASLKVSLLSEAMRQIPLPPGSSVTVIDRRGNVLAHYPEPEKWVGKSLSNAPVVQRILRKKAGVVEMASVEGGPRLHAVTAVDEQDGPSAFVSVGIPLGISFADANQALWRHFGILAVVAALVWFAARFFAQRFFLRPVRALASAAEGLAAGNLSARTGPIHGAAELEQLGKVFDEMADRLQNRQAEIEQAQQEIQRLNQGLEERVRRRTVQLEAANKELEAFSYSVSHDLRAPLRHISGFVKALKEDQAASLSEEGRQYLEAIERAGIEMKKLVDDLLSFSRTGRAEFHRRRVNLEELVEEVKSSLSGELANRAVEWKVGPLPEVQGDAALLRMVLFNLVSNAIKYIRPRHPAGIEIGGQTTEKEQIIFVRDNGVGFDMKYASKLFGVFQRLHDKNEFEGTGVGLANVQRIILRHEGRVWAEAKPEEGATFYFALPR